ncbi:MAG: deoxyribonuclease IV [Chitinivibrionales bacterium]|nr:deoxyribonuclease IV [Chitinivibrionales bacterium]
MNITQELSMIRIGAHVPIAGGVFNAPKSAAALGAKAFALFVANPRMWKAPPLDPKAVDLFKEALDAEGYLPEHIVPHDSYLINLGNKDTAKREKSYTAFLTEMKRCEQLGLQCLNAHPGSHVGEAGETGCLARIAECLNRALDATKGVRILLENTAGQGTTVGYKFEHLAEIISMVEDKSRIGICFDTCHGHAAGYDIRTKEAYENTMKELDSTVGLHSLKALHLNDAKSDFGSRVDRHHSIGKGTLGLEPFRFIVNDPRLDEIPMILETIDDTLWKEEIALLYSLIKTKRKAEKGGKTP